MFHIEPIVNKSIRYIPVAKPSITRREIEAVTRTMQSDWISSGPAVEEFERSFAFAHNRKYGVACNSGGSALVLALRAMDVSDGEIVSCPTLTMVAVPNAILTAGGRPHFIDSRISDGNCDSGVFKSHFSIRAHLYGQATDADVMPYHDATIEDCAECHYSSQIGDVGDLMTFSFYANKIITTGEGGMVLTNSKERGERLRAIRAHAFTPRYHFVHSELAYSMRMTDLQAAIGIVQHKRHRELLAQRSEIASRYTERLQSVPWITLPARFPGSVWWVMNLLADTPERCQKARQRLADEGIETRSYFVPMHRQDHLRPYVSNVAAFPIADQLADCGFYLPLYPDLKNADIDFICKVIESV